MVSATPVEEIPSGEPQAIATMIEALRKQLMARYVEKNQLVRRDAHPKLLGLVHARFIVSPECPAELRHGIFGRAMDTFDADIRFSNGHPDIQHDLAFDVRGMAIKLPAVTGAFLPTPGQDFVLATAEAFFGTNAVDYVGFPDASKSLPKTLWYFIGGRRLRGGWQLLKGQRIPPSPLALEYYSQTPYRLGPHCVKYQARPLIARRGNHDPWYMRPVARQVAGVAAAFSKSVARVIPPDALRNALASDLAIGPVTYEFLVQRWPDLSHMPTWAIEDATRTWPAPWLRVATIEVLQQYGIAGRDAAAERMTFSPWHAEEAHQPLGSINRARLAIYRTMSEFRNTKNQQPSPPV
jgi:hypothetical protein